MTQGRRSARTAARRYSCGTSAAVPKPLWAPWRLEDIEHADEEAECIFCSPDERLVIHRGERALVLLNKFPYASGHLMVAPMRHTGDFGSLAGDEASEIHELAARGTAALVQEYAAQGFNVGW